MRLALLGYPIQHSLSPKIYQQYLGSSLTSYDLLEIENSESIPGLQELAKKYDGLNITSPHKKHFFGKVIVENEVVQKIAALNTISFAPNGEVFGTNTDVIAVESLLKDYLATYPSLHLMILGNGVMAKMTQMLAQKMNIPFHHYYRSADIDLSKVDLTAQPIAGQLMVINACSRNFVFQGKIPSHAIFWDYNYAFIPHKNTLPSKVALYLDGEEMLKRQALAAIEFWKKSRP